MMFTAGASVATNGRDFERIIGQKSLPTLWPGAIDATDRVAALADDLKNAHSCLQITLARSKDRQPRRVRAGALAFTAGSFEGNSIALIECILSRGER